MRALICSRCGAGNPASAVVRGMTAFGLDMVPLRCRECGERSSAIRSFAGYAGFFVIYGFAFLALFLGAMERWPHLDTLLPIIVAAALPALLLPPLFAVLFLRRLPDPDATPPGDLPTARKAGYLAGGLAIALAIIIVGLVAYVFDRVLSRSPTDPDATEIVELGEEALAWRCTTLDGEELALADLRNEVVFLNVWATWCGPCVSELPSIRALLERTADAGVRFLLVSNEEPGTVRAFAVEHDYGLPFATGPRLPEPLATTAIPVTFVLQKGRLVYRHVGAADWDDAAFADWLRAL